MIDQTGPLQNFLTFSSHTDLVVDAKSQGKLWNTKEDRVRVSEQKVLFTLDQVVAVTTPLLRQDLVRFD